MTAKKKFHYKIYHSGNTDVAQKISKSESVESANVIVEVNTNEKDFESDNVVMSRVIIEIKEDYELDDLDEYLQDEFISVWFDF